MINFKIKPFLDTQDMLVQWSMSLHNQKQRSSVSEGEREHLIETLAPLMEELSSQEFDLCRRAGERLIETLKTDDHPGAIVSEIDDLRRRLLDQAELTACLSLSPKARDLYEPRTPLFGADFQAKFATSGVFELDEAAKCFALGRPTASVFHLMRLMEIGIGATARCLSIPDPVKPAERNWGSILKVTAR